MASSFTMAAQTSTEPAQVSPSINQTSSDKPAEDHLQSNGTASKPRELHSPQAAPKYKHVIAIHKRAKDSPLTSGSGQTISFVGFRNLMILVIVVSNLRLMIENYKKYGVLVCIQCHDCRHQDIVYGAILFFLVPLHLLVAYIIEVAAAQQAKGALGRTKKSDDKTDTASKLKPAKEDFESTWLLVAWAHGINATLNLLIATVVVYFFIHHPGIGTLCELHAVIVWLKVCSYAFTNRDLRHALLSPSTNPAVPDLYSTCSYPRNITFGNLSYFWWAPTLVYQPVYPRTIQIRWGFVARRMLEVFILGVAIWIASAQYAVPLLQNSLPVMSSLDIISFLERLMKLSSISLFCWLAGFFALFQSFLNALAEVMTFADRDFYSDWWNSSSVRTYWTSWNKPVSQFMKRHVYMPLIGRGFSPTAAQIIVFVFSGLLHEILVGVPTHNIIGRSSCHHPCPSPSSNK